MLIIVFLFIVLLTDELVAQAGEFLLYL